MICFNTCNRMYLIGKCVSLFLDPLPKMGKKTYMLYSCWNIVYENVSWIILWCFLVAVIRKINYQNICIWKDPISVLGELMFFSFYAPTVVGGVYMYCYSCPLVCRNIIMCVQSLCPTPSWQQDASNFNRLLINLRRL